MKIQIDAQTEAEINFLHQRQCPQLTTATVDIISGSHLGDFTRHRGNALLHPSDSYCRRTGRRVSLTKALVCVPRETRRAIWEGLKKKGVRFFNERRIRRWPV